MGSRVPNPRKTWMYAGIGILISVITKGTVFWDITACSPVEDIDVSEERTSGYLGFVSTLKER